MERKQTNILNRHQLSAPTIIGDEIRVVMTLMNLQLSFPICLWLPESVFKYDILHAYAKLGEAQIKYWYLYSP